MAQNITGNKSVASHCHWNVYNTYSIRGEYPILNRPWTKSGTITPPPPSPGGMHINDLKI